MASPEYILNPGGYSHPRHLARYIWLSSDSFRDSLTNFWYLVSIAPFITHLTFPFFFVSMSVLFHRSSFQPQIYTWLYVSGFVLTHVHAEEVDLAGFPIFRLVWPRPIRRVVNVST
ncbi:hypothetical protein BS17DRAFT_786326 [Gyrodon lividus]|nr:hypothetical protein BS17DRAFT_786326 [Gyrodon lividus]